MTLCPTEETVLSGRGRILSDGERARISQMYAEGYAARPFSHLMVDTGTLDPAASASAILEFLNATR